MGLGTILAILGILISLGFGAWGVFLALRRRYPSEITFVREQTIALFDAIVKNLPELAVLYKGAPVSPNVVLVKGSLINTGRRDISPSMVERPITVSLPAGCKWLNASVISASPDVKASLTVSNLNSIMFTCGLLRCKEFIRFQALAEVAFPNGAAKLAPDSIEDRLVGSLVFDHRIEDTLPVKSLELQGTRHLSARLKLYLVMSGVLLALGVFLGIHGYFRPPRRLEYDLQTGTNQITRVTIESADRLGVAVRSLDGKFNATMGSDEFISKCHPVFVTEKRPIYYVMVIMLVMYICLPIILAIYILREYMANERLRRLLALNELGEAFTANK